MQLTVERFLFTEKDTIGRLLINGVHQCYTLEDVVRPDGAPKVFGGTAIPYGTYPVILSMSPHFGTVLPELQNVPNFEGIRMHGGNTDADTEGCILCAQQIAFENGEPILAHGTSKIAVDALLAVLRATTETITINIVRHPQK